MFEICDGRSNSFKTKLRTEGIKKTAAITPTKMYPPFRAALNIAKKTGTAIKVATAIATILSAPASFFLAWSSSVSAILAPKFA